MRVRHCAGRRRNADPARFAGRMFDRLGQLVPRLAQGVEEDVAATDMLAELRIGMNMLDLKRIETDLPPPLRTHVRTVLDGVAEAFADRLDNTRSDEGREKLLAEIDAALVALVDITDGPTRRTALQAMVGLRRGLFADRQAPVLAMPRHDAPPLAIAAE
ncbi:MAG: hypothetical protein EOP19_22265 [Hyphomicrobiales bacterium]|nr:MAG: hypothetical protein EOP19_22265 [Hyphomicrobiales bacterium]